MKTEFTAEIQGSPEDVQKLLERAAKQGVVFHGARVQGVPVDVGPLVEAAEKKNARK